MRRVLERVNDRLRAFVTQRDFLALVVSIRDSDSPVLVKIVEGLDDASASEMFWSFTAAFDDAWSYSAAVLNAFREKYEPVRMVLEKENGPLRWPEFPADRFYDGQPPDERLRELMVFSRELLPAPAGTLAVWALLPLAIGDPDDYAQLMARVLDYRLPNPWCSRLRVIVRDGIGATPLSERLADAGGIDWYVPDLSVETLQAAIEDDTADETLAVPERFQAVLMSAGVDYAHGRHEQALQKYELAFRYYEATDNPPFAAIAMNGMGEIHQALGDEDSAGVLFESALGPATAGEPIVFPVLLNVLLNLANLRLAQQQWEEAEAYYDNADKVATIARNPPAKIQSLECLGYAMYQQERFQDACDTWELGASIAGELHEPELQRSILERLAFHYRSVDDTQRLAEIEASLAWLEEPPAEE
jgi:tetratricopeptide (TPR) repeat protein